MQDSSQPGGAMTRRVFVGGALVTGAALLAGGLAGCASGGGATPAGASDSASAGGATAGGNASDNAGVGTNSNSATDNAASTAAAPADSNTAFSSIYVIKNTDGTDDGVERLIALMAGNSLDFYRTAGNPEGLIAADDVVLIKVNSQWAERGGTNTDLLKRVALAVAGHPEGFTGEIVVADNGQGQYGTGGKGGSLDWPATNAADKTQSALDVVKALKPEMRISGCLWDDFTLNQVAEFADGDVGDGFVIEAAARATGVIVSYAKFTTEYGTPVSFKRGVWDAATQSYDSGRLKVINLPVLKVHGGYQVTGALKAYMGTTANQLTSHAAHNSVGNGGMGTQMANTRVPTLNIMDMIWVGVAQGPATKYAEAVEADMIAGSTDPVALDWWCAKNVLMPMIEAGGSSSAKQDPDATDAGSFGYWLALAADELRAAGWAANLGDAVKAVL